jgi:hypothetical protein
MAGLDDAFVNPLDELRETSINVANGSTTSHPAVAGEKTADASSSSSSSSSASSSLLSESNQKNGS